MVIGFLVYPWVDASSLPQNTVSEKHALKIAAILAKIHQLNLDAPEIPQIVVPDYTDDMLLEIIAKAESFDCPFSADLRKHHKSILAANRAYQNAKPILRSQLVISHGDLDQKNVLWNADSKPLLIDWEAVHKLNPTYDIINTAFSWSGINTRFDSELFLKMLGTYQGADGILDKDHITAACYSAFSCIDWLAYNINRSCFIGKSEQKNVGTQQANQTISTILLLKKLIPKVIKLIEGNF
jgi:thiamine kinase-like enzyme